MVLKRIGSSTYLINSDKNFTGEMKVHFNHLKPFTISNTEGWSLNMIMKYLKQALHSLNLEIFQGINVHIDFKNLSLLTLQLLNANPKKIFLIPEWHCAPWYNPLHGILKSKTNSVKLPNEQDLFLDSFGNELGVFSWNHWLFSTKKTYDLEGSYGTQISFLPSFSLREV